MRRARNSAIGLDLDDDRAHACLRQRRSACRDTDLMCTGVSDPFKVFAE